MELSTVKGADDTDALELLSIFGKEMVLPYVKCK